VCARRGQADRARARVCTSVIRVYQHQEERSEVSCLHRVRERVVDVFFLAKRGENQEEEEEDVIRV
jgi:hypothetical protein